MSRSREYKSVKFIQGPILIFALAFLMVNAEPTCAQSKRLSAWDSNAYLNSELLTGRPRRGSKVDVSGSGFFTDFSDNVRITSSVPELQLSDTQSGGRMWRLMSGSSAAGYFNVYDNNAGAYRLTIDTSGNVGIGTTSPFTKLLIVGAGAGTALNVGASASVGNYVDIYGNATNGGTVHIGTNYWTTDGSLALGTATTPDSLTINTTGNVGIGTTSPGALLSVGHPWGSSHIAGFAGATGRIGVYSTTASTPGFIDFTTNSQTAYVGLNGSAANGFFSSNGLVSALSVMSPGGKAVQIGEAGTSPAVTVLAGSVGIGTSAPSSAYKLDVNGDVRVSGNIAAKYQDVAEWVPASEQLSAGTVVVLDSTKSNQVTSSTVSYDTRVAGVVSEQPGIALGEKSEGKVLVATTGRVRVKVDASKGPIHIGDLLVTSDVPGIAMKSEPVNLGGVQFHRPGTLIGKALEPLEKGKGEILVLLSLQ
jgi:hypothetical protein